MLFRYSKAVPTLVSGCLRSVRPNLCPLLENKSFSSSLSTSSIPNPAPKSFNSRLLQRNLSLSQHFVQSRKMSSGSVQAVKKNYLHYLDMNLAEKRAQYKCGEKYVQLEGVDTWTQYAGEVQLPPVKGEAAFPLNPDLNNKVSIWRGDITTLEIDAICNAANNSLLGGGGVDGAIHSAAGKDLVEECKTLNGCDTGDAKITGGYKLPAKYVIHTVGPRGEKPDMLQSCYSKCLNLLVNHGLRSVAFPCISTGIYGYPSGNAAHVALKTVRTFLQDNPDKIDRVIFCIFLPEDLDIYNTLMQQYFPISA